jgi:pimeloyl-ACP methyl ester carboxylesterase
MRIPHEKGYAAGPFGQLHYMVCGTGIPLVLVHQCPDSMVQFVPVMEFLGGHGIQAIAVDIPGYGMSDVPDHPPSMAEYAQILPAIMDHFDLSTANLLGHHTGALVVTEAALQSPDRVDKLILNGPFPLTDDERDYFKGGMAAEKTWGIEWDGSHLSAQWEHRKNAQTEWIDIEAFHAHFVHGLLAGKTIWYAHDAVMAYKHEDAIPKIQSPCLILANTGDAIYAMSQRTREMRPDFAYQELSGGTIDIIDEQPEQWSAAVASFLQS